MFYKYAAPTALVLQMTGRPIPPPPDAPLARIATLTAAIAAFGKVMNTPRGQIVNKSALLREVETDTAALVQLATDMDDLALQFDGTDAGKRFIEAWKRARIIVDSGGGHSNGGIPPTPPTPLTTTRSPFVTPACTTAW